MIFVENTRFKYKHLAGQILLESGGKLSCRAGATDTKLFLSLKMIKFIFSLLSKMRAIFIIMIFLKTENTAVNEENKM